ncbi:MAG TPA: c-type cytochrome [Gemmata sp.]|jgi:mono/diheme cytochrome c family protein|nr:c-type cytochrome [Gemmata sp.]
MPSRYCLFISCAVFVFVRLILFGGSQTASAQAPPDKPVSFINDVAPILKKHCFSCHNAKKRLGKYDMTTFERLMAGGANGEQIVAGKPEMSGFYNLMVTAEERRMPPRGMGEVVPKDKAAIIARWIKEGAEIDAGLDTKADLVKELRVRWKPPVHPKDSPPPVVVNTLAVTPDGKQLIVGGHHELVVWAIDTGKPVKRIYTRSERAYGLAFLPDGNLAVAGGRPGEEGGVDVYRLKAKGKVEGDIEILDGVNDTSILVKHLFDVEDSVLCLSVAADGKTLAAGGCDRAVRVFDMSRGLEKAKLEQTVENHSDWVLGCALSADGRYLVTNCRDKSAKVWDLKIKESVVTFRTDMSGSTTPNPTPHKSTEPTQNALTMEASTKKSDRKLGETEASMKAAAVLYRQYCLTCHGTDGRGKELRASMPQLPDFSSKEWQKRNSSSHTAVSILEGKGKLMPAFRGLVTEEQARNLAAHVKAFGPENANQPNQPNDDFEKQYRELEQQFKALQQEFIETQKLPPKRW